MDYLAVLLAGVEGLRQRLPVISEAADQVAGRLAADGRLLLASARPDFTSEGVRPLWWVDAGRGVEAPDEAGTG